MSNVAEKKLFDCAVRAIKCYLPVRPSKHAKFIFFLLVKLIPFLKPSINLNCTKSESHSKNSNISNGVNISNKIDDEVIWIDGLPFTNIGLRTDFNHTKNESCNVYYNISNRVNNEVSWADQNRIKS